MAGKQITWKTRLSRSLRSWQAPAAVGLVLLAGMIYWLAPRPVERVVPVDESARWTEKEAPPRRQIVWRPAREIPSLLDEQQERGELAASTPAADGSMRFFSRRIEGRQSDLYVARMKRGMWQPAEPLDELNTLSNEVEPVLSPDGAFLYFASDRPARSGEPPNLDLYRARISGGRFLEPENLGPGINTAAHETEPGLSAAGFTIVFSSDRGGADRLYASTATEVYSETGWDASRVKAINVPGWWWIPLLLLILAGLVLPALSYRDRLLAKVWPARFFLGGVLVNLLVLFLLAVWTLPEVFDAIVAKVQEVVPAPDFVDDNQHQSHEDGRESHEKVADLKSVEPAPLPLLVRKVIDPLSVPERTENMVPTIPLDGARVLPPESVIFVPPPQPIQPVEKPRAPTPIARRRPRQPAAALAEQDLIDRPLELAAVQPPRQSAVDAAEIDVARDPAEPAAPAPPQDVSMPAPLRPSAAAIDEAAPADLAAKRSPQRQQLPLTRSVDRRSADVVASADAPSLDALIQPVPSESQLPAQISPVDRTRSALNDPQPPSAARTPVPPPNAVPRRGNLASVQSDAEIKTLASDRVPVPLGRSTLSARRPAAATDAPDEQRTVLAAAETPDEAPPPEIELEVARTFEMPIEAAVPTPRELTGPVTRFKHRVVVGEFSDKKNDAPPAFSPLATRLDRRRARATRVALAEDNVGIRSLFTLRQGETRRKYIKLLGGTDESEKAVNLGLEWLAKHQQADGSWDLTKHDGKTKSNAAGTGLGLLPFLAAGYTHQKPGRYQKNVAAAVRWLLDNQKENGDLLGPGDQQHMYSHGIAAIALCEAYGMSRDEELKEAARKSLDFIVAAQHQGSGGWRYNPNQPADTSVVGWQMMALKSGEMAGLTVAQPVYDHVDRWLTSVEGQNKLIGTFGYTSRAATPAMTAEGLLCMQFMGRTGRNDARMRSGADFLMANLPEPNQQGTSYYWYYGTQVMYHMQGKYWEAWNERLRDMLVETQLKSGEHAGTWHPRDRWEASGGRLYATSLKLLMLEVYYRHLPLYEQLEE